MIKAINDILNTYMKNPLLEQYSKKFKKLLENCDTNIVNKFDNEILLFNELLLKDDFIENIVFENDNYKIVDISTYSQLLQSGLFNKKPGSFLNEWFFKLYFPNIKKCIVIVNKHKKDIDNDVICICLLNDNSGFVTNLNNAELDLSYTHLIHKRYFDNDDKLLDIVKKLIDINI